MNVTFLNDYINIVVLGICLCLGYVIKHSLSFINNKYIPLIMLVIGTILNIMVNFTNINATVILGGMISGLASTGMYEALRSFIEGKEKEE